MLNNQTATREFTSRIYASTSITRKSDIRYELDTILDKLAKEAEVEIKTEA